MSNEPSENKPDLQSLIDATNIGIIYLDGELRVKLFTQAASRIFVINDSDLGRPVYELPHGLPYKDLKKDLEEVIRSQKAIEHEFEIGDNNWHVLRLVPYTDAVASVSAVILTFTDITKRMQAEQSIRWLSSAVESSNDAVFTFAFDRNIITWNAGAESIFGYLAEEAIGHPLSMLTQPGREIEENDLFNKTWGGEKVEKFETVHINKDGTAIDISLNLSPVRDENDRIIGMSATVHDITKRKEADEKLRATEERQSLLIDSATDFAIFTLSTEGIVNSWNTGAERVFGFTESEIIGQPGAVLFTPEDRARGIPQNEMTTAAEKGRAEDERYHIRRDGTRFYASGVMTPLLDGGLHGFAKIARDLTERKLAEEALSQARDDLETKVDERTAELADSNESLRLEIVERLRAEEVRVGLLRKIVTTQEDERRRIARDLHDTVGQRLTALRLKIASLKDECGEHEAFQARVERLAEIGAKVDEEISFLAWELRPAALDDFGLIVAAGNYVNEWSRHFEIPAEFHSTGLKNGQLDPDTETHLYRIVQEALNNVYKHAQAGQASVLLERRENMVVLIIEDDGEGFDPKAGVKVKKSGRGLGLIGMRERAALVGGSIEIESEPGSGTTVFVRVPLNGVK